MAKKAERVELFEQGIFKLALTDSDAGSLNGRVTGGVNKKVTLYIFASSAGDARGANPGA